MGLKRTLIKDLSGWVDQPWIVEEDSAEYCGHPAETSFTSQEAAEIYMDERARKGVSTKLYFEKWED